MFNDGYKETSAPAPRSKLTPFELFHGDTVVAKRKRQLKSYSGTIAVMKSLFTALLLCSISRTALVLAKACPIADTSMIAHDGTPVGKEEVVDGGAISTIHTLVTRHGVIKLTKAYMQSHYTSPSPDARAPK